MAIQIGQPAPTFTLYDTEKKAISLSDYRDKKIVLLLFFPLAFTSTCTEELCTVRDEINKYKNAQTEVFGISVDSVYTLAKYKEELRATYSFLSDFNKKVSELYECIYTSFGAMKMEGISKRAAFIIDTKGLVQHVDVLEDANNIPDFSLIDKKLAELADITTGKVF